MSQFFFGHVLHRAEMNCVVQLTFGREYTAAVEAKQVAQQEAERAKFIVRMQPNKRFMLHALEDGLR